MLNLIEVIFLNKITINVFVPLIDCSYDMNIPINLKMSDVIKLIQETIHDLSNGDYVINKNAKLYDKSTAKLINLNNIVKYSGLTNGACVMLL